MSVNSPWNLHGVLPPIPNDRKPTSGTRSPYRVSVMWLVAMFGFSPARLALLDGLVRYRSRLRELGIAAQFQWVNGSFLEDCETTRGRGPDDIDVVTFVDSIQTPEEDIVALLKNGKAEFGVHGFFVETSLAPRDFAQQVVYWESVFAHRRGDFMWKGFVELDIDHSEDDEAKELISSLLAQED